MNTLQQNDTSSLQNINDVLLCFLASALQEAKKIHASSDLDLPEVASRLKDLLFQELPLLNDPMTASKRYSLFFAQLDALLSHSFLASFPIKYRIHQKLLLSLQPVLNKIFMWSYASIHVHHDSSAIFGHSVAAHLQSLCFFLLLYII